MADQRDHEDPAHVHRVACIESMRIAYFHLNDALRAVLALERTDDPIGGHLRAAIEEIYDCLDRTYAMVFDSTDGTIEVHDWVPDAQGPLVKLRWDELG